MYLPFISGQSVQWHSAFQWKSVHCTKYISIEGYSIIFKCRDENYWCLFVVHVSLEEGTNCSAVPASDNRPMLNNSKNEATTSTTVVETSGLNPFVSTWIKMNCASHERLSHLWKLRSEWACIPQWTRYGIIQYFAGFNKWGKPATYNARQRMRLSSAITAILEEMQDLTNVAFFKITTWGFESRNINYR